MKLTCYLPQGETLEVRTLPMDSRLEPEETLVVNLYPDVQFETFEGFGGAITEAAAYVYSLLNEDQKRQVIRTYFSPDEMNYRLVRVHMDSCDFSLGLYEAVSEPDLTKFSFAGTEKYILPMLEDARAAAGGDLKLMLSPWSPPAFMKTNGQRKHGGRLKPEFYQLYARYICRYIREFQDRGFTVQRISIQNEPNAIQIWDSCNFTAREEKAFLQEALYPALQAQGMGDIEIFIWDHNKERLYERVRDVLDEKTAPMVAGAAFHWYSGDHFEALDLVRQAYPGLKLIMSESCLEYRLYDPQNIAAVTNRLCHEIIGDLSHGMCAFYDWNILLDEEGGPNHVGNFCHAPFLFDRQSKKLLPQKTQQQFYQFSHFITPGSRRIGLTKYCDAIDAVAYRTVDGRLVTVLLNKSSQETPVIFRVEGSAAQVILPAGGLVTCVME